MKYTVQPATADRWDDLEELFGPQGAVGGCWCMFWRVKGDEFRAKANKAGIQKIVARNQIPGLLAYAGSKPVGWVSLAPREEFGRIERSPLFKRVDDQPVWSVVCFFIDEDYRNKGVGKALLRAAHKFAKSKGARMLEAYPIDTKGKRRDPGSIFTGTEDLFKEAGYKETARRKERRPMMRKKL